MQINTTPQILVVDDMRDIRKIVQNFLQKMGFTRISEAEDGLQAIKHLEAGEFGLIIADWNMPNMNGLELLDAVRNNDNWKNIPFIMLTAEASKDNIVLAALHNVTDYIVKPFTANVLREKVLKILSKK